MSATHQQPKLHAQNVWKVFRTAGKGQLVVMQDLLPVVHQQVVIDLPRPRSLLETEADVRFARLRKHILTLIRKEARLTMEQETVLNTP